MEKKRKLNVLSISDKVRLIQLVEKCVIAKEFNIPPNTLSSIIKQKEKIMKFNCGNNLFSHFKGDLDLLLKAGKPVYSYYGHGDAQQWSYVLGCGATNAHGTMKALKVYMDAHPGIKGLIFSNLEYTDTSKEYPKYTENLMAYIKLMRESFSNLEIGLLILGNPMMKQFENPKRKWLDIKVLEPSVDFFVVSVTRLNNCTLESRVDSMAPISGNRGYTMTKLQELLGKNGFPDKKVYYSIALNPTSNVTTLFQSWNTTYQEACTHQKNAGKFCVEKTSTYYQKGEFVKKHAAGFIGSCVDFSDPDNKCGCDRPFAPFYDVLDGFNGKPAPKECSILDKL